MLRCEITRIDRDGESQGAAWSIKWDENLATVLDVERKVVFAGPTSDLAAIIDIRAFMVDRLSMTIPGRGVESFIVDRKNRRMLVELLRMGPMNCDHLRIARKLAWRGLLVSLFCMALCFGAIAVFFSVLITDREFEANLRKTISMEVGRLIVLLVGFLGFAALVKALSTIRALRTIKKLRSQDQVFGS